MKRLTLTVALASASIFSTSVNAAIIDFGILSDTPTTKIGQMNVTSRDIALFELSSASDLGASLRSFVFNLGSPIRFESLTATLFGGTTASGPVLATLAAGGDITVPNLAAGQYSFSIDGVVPTGAAGGIYALSLASTAAAPVPGPAGLLVGGVALGAIAWRHRKRKVAAV